MKNTYLNFLIGLIALPIFSQQVLSPSEFLGYELGTRFTRHHQVVDYFQNIAQNSNQIQLISYGTTYEGRKLQLAYISTSENLSNLDEIRKNHLIQSGLSEGVASSVKPKSIVWLSYNVHGNEAVSTEAAMKTIYTLVTEKSDWLENLVVIMDPCINPDGRDRYVNWYNQVKSTPFDDSPIANEHYENWPSGRYNHYYFDLNRDWAWVTQKETQQRLKYYHQWYPQIHVDFHEQGVDSPYYFAPAAEPLNEVVTDFQRKFQHTIGKNHAAYFDKEGWSYFTKEVFDLLYPGYGDTYPMFHGAIGMTYEQGGSGRAGLSIKNKIGDNLTLKDRIAHHYTTGLSTVEVAHKNSNLLNEEFRKYFSDNKKVKYATYAMDGTSDKVAGLKKLLDIHHIPYTSPEKNTILKGWNYSTQKNSSLNLSANAVILDGTGEKGAFIQALFEPNPKLSDSVTYDITSWALPYAHGLKAVASQQKLENTIPSTPSKAKPNTETKAYAYAVEWGSLKNAKFLAELLKQKIRVRYNLKPISNGGKNWKEGSLFILKGENKTLIDFDATINEIALKTNQNIFPLASGYSDSGLDLGSNQMKFIPKKRVGLIKSDDTSPQGYGEVWHFFEQQLSYPVTQIQLDRLSESVLAKFDVLILPPGYYKLFSKKDSELLEWVKKGGRIIALGSAVKAFADKEPFQLKKKKKSEEEEEEDQKQIPFAETDRNSISSAIYGSVFYAKVDITHPLAFGYDKHYYSLKNAASAYSLLDKGSVVRLPKNINPVAGFSGHKAIKKQSESLVFGMERIGKGEAIYLIDNPLYRGFWENGKLWIVNAVFH